MSNADRDAQDPPRQPELLRWLRWKIAARPPYCQGTLALPNSDFTLFYGTEGDAHRINLSASSTAQLQHLAETCVPATFGVAGEDVYDETYRKAGKLDNKDFAIGFDARSSSLVDVIRTELLVESPTWVTSENLNIELYKLNVYGKDAFFKAHVDTPRSELMFGSLVIVFPTPHEGGALKLRATGDGNGRMLEWTFDSSALLAQQEQPSIAYVAFFSDVEHEVMPVTSGHRVSITYNLFYAVTPSPSEPSSPTLGVPVPRQISTNEQSFTDALRAVLADPSFLPDGGSLMFGLRHQYPLATASESEGRYMRRRDTEEERETARAALRALEGRLKATDGVMLRALRGSGLDAGLRVLYEAHWSKWDRTMGYVMADRVLPLPHVDQMIEESAVEVLQGEGGELVQDAVVLMARAIKREKARAEAKVRLEARAAERAKAKAEAEAKAEAKAKAKAEAEAGTKGEAEANKDEAKSKTNKDSAEAIAEKEQDKDEAESEGKEHDEDDDDNDSDEDQDDEDEEEDKDEAEDEDEEEDEDEDEEEDEDEDDYEYELAHAFPWSRDDDATPVFWVTDPPRMRSGKGFQKTIQTYGNEPTLDVVYWRIWIFARVGSVGQRETAQARASEE